MHDEPVIFILIIIHKEKLEFFLHILSELGTLKQYSTTTSTP